MKTTRHTRITNSPSTATRLLLIAFLVAGLALLTSGCRSGRGTTPETADPSSKPLMRTGDPSSSSDGEVTSRPAFDTEDDPAARRLPLSIEELNEQLYRDGLLGEVFFAFDRADIDQGARERLERNAAYMLREPDATFAIEGHCDERGTNEYNLALGHRRAAATREFLTARGIDPKRLSTLSYGEERGVCNLSNEGCWSRNRRAFFRVTNN